MKVLSTSQMVACDQYTINILGIPSHDLMENAGRALFERILYHRNKRGLVFLIGPGNNGGDGLVAANLAQAQLIPYTIVKTNDELLAALSQNSHVLIVDALFGTGLKHDVVEPIRSVIESVNSSNAFVISADIPSGISGDTGKIMGAAIMANETVTFGYPKIGFFQNDGLSHTGDIYVADIGLSLEGVSSNTDILTYAEMVSTATERPVHSNKGDYGHVLIMGGSRGCEGAVRLATHAALRSGVGLVTTAVPESIYHLIASTQLEAMTQTLAHNHELVKNKTAIVIGPGMGISDDAVSEFEHVITQSQCPVIIDADGINNLAKNVSILKKAKAPIILTPHPKEMARLLNKDVAYVEEHRLNCSKEFATTHHVYVVLKGYRTVITTPTSHSWIIAAGNPYMATGGMGDVLAGLIGGMCAMGEDITQTIIQAVFLHSATADYLSEKTKGATVLGSDVITAFPKVSAILKDGSQWTLDTHLIPKHSQNNWRVIGR